MVSLEARIELASSVSGGFKWNIEAHFIFFQVLLAMKANVEDRGIKGDCTPLMEAASGGYVDIVKLLIAHGADVNAQSSAGKLCSFYGQENWFSGSKY